MSTWADDGLPFPLGQSWVEASQAYNFALYSKHASQVTLLLYDDPTAAPVRQIDLDHLRHKTGRVWHVRVPGSEAGGATYYAYRIDGPPSQGGYEQHAFDPLKTVVDPYARCVYFPPGFSQAAAIRPGSNAGQAPLGVLLGPPSGPPAPAPGERRRQRNLIVYEMHVRGFTRNPNSGVSAGKRGSYAGVVEKIPYLKELGVTAVELMPVYQGDPQEGNYWGYSPLFFFVPSVAYTSSDDGRQARDEFRAMVDALHAADIDVILDVVYNHTAEGGRGGPCYSLKLIDNSTYYMIDPASGDYANYSGTGNSLHCANATVRRLILDSMRYWVAEMGVDGFRFDLASVFSRNDDGSINVGDPPIFGQIAGDASFDGIHLIAEPWDAGGAYQLGAKFPGLTWRQWNGQYRDTIQRFVKGDPGLVGEMMTRVYGSADLFPDSLLQACRPFQSVNYVVSHDGFTLHDLVSYDRKHNEANGHGNTDGPTDLSWNCGWEGDAGAPAEVQALRQRQMRNFVTLLLVSNGTPMLRMGDEFGQTQLGNNNPYNQDTSTTWLDWDRLATNGDLFRFVKGLIAFRKAHPGLGRASFWRDDVAWYGVGRAVDLSPDSRSLAFCVHGAAAGDTDVYVMASAYWEALDFEIQEPGPWTRVVDTARPSPDDVLAPGSEAPVASPRYTVQPRSVVVLVRG